MTPRSLARASLECVENVSDLLYSRSHIHVNDDKNKGWEVRGKSVDKSLTALRVY